MTARGRRGFSRSRVVEAGLEVARHEGLDALTMRRVAIELETGPASLYRHVADRRELLGAMLDVVASEIEVPPTFEDPEDEMVAVVRAVRTAFRGEAWAARVLAVEGLSSTGIVPFTERMFAAMGAAGLDAAQSAAADALIWQWVYGEVLFASHFRADSEARKVANATDRRQFPHTASAAAALPSHPDELFESNELFRQMAKSTTAS